MADQGYFPTGLPVTYSYPAKQLKDLQGNLLTVGTANLAASGVTPGTYPSSTVTVDATGRITSASNSFSTTGQLAFNLTAASGTGAVMPALMYLYKDAAGIVACSFGAGPMNTGTSNTWVSAAGAVPAGYRPSLVAPGATAVVISSDGATSTYKQGIITVATDGTVTVGPAYFSSISANATYVLPTVTFEWDSN